MNLTESVTWVMNIKFKLKVSKKALKAKKNSHCKYSLASGLLCALTKGSFTISKSDRSDTNEIQFLPPASEG